MEFLNRGPTVFVVCLVFAVLATVFIVLRLVSKWGVTRKVTSDDFVAIIAWVLGTGLSVCIMIGTQVGLGAPDAEILLTWETQLRRCVYSFTVLYNPALMTTKTAILLLYHRMAAAHLFLRYASLITMIVVNLAGIILTFLSIFQCRPISAAFTDIDGTCIDIVALYLASAPINIITDLAILLLPLPVLTTLRMDFRQKFILVVTFIAFGFVTIVDVVRIVYLQEALKVELEVNPAAAITAKTRPPNFTYYASFSLMWSAVEVSVGIVCCCVLVLKPLIVRIMPKSLGSPRQHRLSSATKEAALSFDPLSQRTPDGVDGTRLMDSSAPTATSHQVSMPMSPQLGYWDSESPTSPQPPTMSPIPEIVNADEDAALDFSAMLSSEPAAPSVPLQSTLEKVSTRHSRRSFGFAHRRDTSMTNTTQVSTQAPSETFLDFVRIKSKVPLTQLSAKEAWWPIMFVSSLFFLWGFALGLLGSLNAAIQNLLGYTSSQTLALHNIYWVGYFFGPLCVGYWVLKHQGYKATFMTGLAMYATGAMSFWPSSVLRSYAGFLVSNFVIALGLSCLGVAANPFIALAGPGELSEARLNFAEAFQAIGNVISPIIAQKALLSGIDREDLFRIQWYYLAVALFVVALVIVFYYVPLSEAPDAELEIIAQKRLYNAGLVDGVKAFGVNARSLLLWSGVSAMVIYSGGGEIMSYFWTPLVTAAKPASDPSSTQSISLAVKALCRFFAAGLCYCGIPPRILVAVFALGAFTCTLIAMLVPQGSLGVAMLILVTFFLSPIFPTIFAITIRGQGKHTHFASAALIMAEVGGAVWPSIAYGVHHGDSVNTLIVAVVLWGLSILWPTMLSLSRVMKRWVDPRWSRQRSAPDDPGIVAAAAL